MPNKIDSFFRQTNLTLVAAAFVVVAGTLGVLWASTQAEPRDPEVSVSQSAPAYKERVRFWIHGDGIRPRIAKAKPGMVLLTCENKTILNAELVVERVLPDQTMQALGSLSAFNQRGRSTREFLLVEGEYVVYERSRPALKATLLVSP